MAALLKPPVPTSAQRRLRWHQLYGSAGALALAEASKADSRLYVVVTSGARDVERLTAEIRFFAGNDRTLLTLPDWEVLPYDLFSPGAADSGFEVADTLLDLRVVIGLAGSAAGPASCASAESASPRGDIPRASSTGKESM